MFSQNTNTELFSMFFGSPLFEGAPGDRCINTSKNSILMRQICAI